MRTRKKVTLAAMCAAVGVGALWLALSSRDEGPSYQGHTLSELVRSHSLEYNRDESGRKQAHDAIGHIGTNAIPYLLDWMQYEEPRWLWRLRNAKWNRFAKDPFRSERSERAAVTDQAFDALGPATEEAVGRLTLLVNQTKSERIAFRALCALAATGSTNALPPIVAILTNHSARLHLEAAYVLVVMGKTAQPAVPVLVACLKDSDEQTAQDAARTLGDMKLDPETVVPALVSALNDPRPMVQGTALLALREFDAGVQSAIPTLLNLLQSQDYGRRSWATNAIRKIQPDLLPPAPAK